MESSRGSTPGHGCPAPWWPGCSIEWWQKHESWPEAAHVLGKVAEQLLFRDEGRFYLELGELQGTF